MCNVDNFMTPTLKINLRNELKSELARRNILTARSKSKAIRMLDVSGDSDIENDDFDRRKKLRYQAIEEILTSEKTYIHQLEKLMEYFVLPLKEKLLIDNKTHTQLFGQLELIYNLNRELLLELEADLNDVANAFLKLAPFFKLYSVYAFDYKNSLITIQNLTTKNPSFRKFIDGAETRPEVQQKLNALMIVPIQRVPRYRLLLQQVLLYTSPSDKDYKLLQESVKQIEGTVSHINTVIEDQENTQTLLNLQNSLINRSPNIVKPSRKIIKEGVLYKFTATGCSMKRYCILLSDIFMYCKLAKERNKNAHVENSLECCCIFPLKKCKVTEIFAGKFKLTCMGDGMILSSDDVQNSRNWIQAIKDTIELHVECRKTIRKDSSKRKPMRNKDVKNFENDILSPGDKKANFDKVFYGKNASKLDLNQSEDENKTNCLRLLKRRHSDSTGEETRAKKAKTSSVLSSVREKFRSKKPEPPRTRSILSYKSENQNQNQCQSTSGDYYSYPLSPNQSVMSGISITNTPTRKRVKFDELNLITSSITYQRQLNSSYQYTGIIPPKVEKNQSMLSKFLDFTANLF